MSPYSEFFWSVFSRILTEFGEILHISSYSVQIQENTDQKNSKYGHFLRRVIYILTHRRTLGLLKTLKKEVFKTGAAILMMSSINFTIIC